jgi:hypothetical protein
MTCAPENDTRDADLIEGNDNIPAVLVIPETVMEVIHLFHTAATKSDPSMPPWPEMRARFEKDWRLWRIWLDEDPDADWSPFGPEAPKIRAVLRLARAFEGPPERKPEPLPRIRHRTRP